ncbi:hypothetical protein L1049_024425 [Liquidambar formosana]|uniref:Uncharacterized protein n=1 Tax=Liquidambar formosana TaxID=63359 RepID=A0AAP0X193_LIQFO
MVRAPCYDKNGLKKGAWSPEEDNKLRAYIQRYGHWNWRELPKFAGLSRCGKSCRLRWMNYLRPNVKRGNYTKEEDELIIKLHQELGNKWSVISTKLSGRTDNEIKNHWHTHLKKRSGKQNPPTSERRKRSVETSRCEANQKEGLEPKNVFAHNASPQILESTPLSPELSSSEFSSLSADYALVSNINWVAEESITSSETFGELDGNFWTQPFLADNSYIEDDFPSLLAAEGGFLSPYVSSYDDSVDLFYQLMHELPKK